MIIYIACDETWEEILLEWYVGDWATHVHLGRNPGDAEWRTWHTEWPSNAAINQLLQDYRDSLSELEKLILIN